MGWKKLVIAALMLAGAWLIYDTAREPQPPGLQVKATAVERRDLTTTLELYGRIAPQRTYALMSETGGRVNRLYVDEGDYVAQGELLFCLDSSALKAQHEMLQLQYDAEKLAIDSEQEQRRQQKLDSVSVLAQGPGISLEDFTSGVQQYSGSQEQESQTQLAAAQARLELYQAQMRELERQIGTMDYCAPESGRVLLCNLQFGGLLPPGTPAVVIGSGDAPVLSAQVGQSDMEKLRIGMQATVWICDQAHTGLIQTIAPMAQTTQSLQGVETLCTVTIALLQPVDVVMDTTARATVLIGHETEVACVPVEAVRFEGDVAFVWVVMEDQTVRRLAVRSQGWDGFYVRVPELVPGTQVLLDPPEGLLPGDLVAPYD